MTDPARELAPILGEARLHHVGIAVPVLADALAQWQQLAGGVVTVHRDLPEQGVEAAALKLGEREIELVAPRSASPGTGPIASYLERRGSGLHHIALEVDDIHDALARAGAANLRAIDAQPRPGLHGTLVAFLHPRSVGGVLVELVAAGPVVEH